MMALINVLLQGLLFVFITKITFSSKECIKSSSTVKKVEGCPRTLIEWKKAAAIKKCDNSSHPCSSHLIYHCVMNAWRNESVEVCAPNIGIVGNVCPEYNEGGHRIQRSEKHCSKCPVTYNSSQSYKYHECYHHNSQPKNQSTKPTAPIYDDITNHSQVIFDASANGKSSNTSSLNFRAKQQKDYTGLGFISVLVMCSMLVILLFTVALYIKRSKISSCIKKYGSSVNENSTENLLTVEGTQIDSERFIAAKIQL